MNFQRVLYTPSSSKFYYACKTIQLKKKISNADGQWKHLLFDYMLSRNKWNFRELI